jgi:hypothetical protein
LDVLVGSHTRHGPSTTDEVVVRCWLMM